MGRRGRPKKVIEEVSSIVEASGSGEGKSPANEMLGEKLMEITKEIVASGSGVKTPGVRTTAPLMQEGDKRKTWCEEIEKDQRSKTLEPPAQMRNYADALRGNRDTANGWTLIHTPLLVNTNVVAIPPEETEEACEKWKNALVGFVAGAKPRFREMEGFVKFRWGAGGPTVHMLQEGIFLFDFKEDGAAKERILDQNWAFRGHPLILRPWTPDVDLSKLEVEKIPVWVQFPKLPLSCWSPRILGRIASYIGVPLATDQLTATKGRLSYARVFVEMKLKDALHYQIPVAEAGKEFMQEVRYEWQPLRCGRCKQMGHDTFNCSKPEQPQPVQQIWVVKKPEVQMQTEEQIKENETVEDQSNGVESIPEIIVTPEPVQKGKEVKE